MDLGSLIGNGGPLGIAAAVAGYLLKTAIDWQREKRAGIREDKKTDREGDSQLVQTTDAALKMVRDQMLGQKTTIDEHSATIRQLEKRVSELEAENLELRGRLIIHEQQR